jgi:phage recombination protein Bet
MTAVIEKIEQPTGVLALTSDQSGWTETQKAALAQIGLDKAPDADLSVFLHYCQRTGMDPFTKQIYMIGRWDGKEQRTKYTIQMAIDGFRIIAERSRQYIGQTEPLWCGPDGVWRDVWTFAEPPVAAKIGVLRHGWPAPTYAVAHFKEFAAKYGNSLTAMWQQMPANQIAKCAEAAALRKAFPHDLSGIYIPEEMEQADQIQVPESLAKMEPEPDPIDWDARIVEVEGNYDGLRGLWSEVKGLEPNNLELLERIAALGEAAKGAAEAAAAEANIVDAEVVDEPAEEPAQPSEEELTDALSAAQAREQEQQQP